MKSFLTRLMVAAALTLAAAPAAFAQIQTDDLYFDFEVEKRAIPVYMYCVQWDWGTSIGHPITECFATALKRDMRVLQLQNSTARILDISEGPRWPHGDRRWRLHSVEDTLAGARSIANLLEGTGQWETRITPVYAPFSFLDDRFSFDFR